MSPRFMMVIGIVGVLLICGINCEKNYGRRLLEDYCPPDDDENFNQTDQPVLVPYGFDLTQVRDQGNTYIIGEPIDPADLETFNTFEQNTCDSNNTSDTPTLDEPIGVGEPLLTSDQNTTQSNQIPFGVDLTEVRDLSDSNTFNAFGVDEYF